MGLPDQFEFEIKKSRTGGYYHRFCKDEHRTCHSSAEELIDGHCFEDFRTWSNRNIRKSNSLALYGSTSDATTAARIIVPKKLKQLAQNGHIILPIAVR